MRETGKPIGDFIVSLEDGIPSEEIDDKEIEYIALYRKRGKLCNLTDGGKGFMNFSQESYRKAAETRRGQKRSKETRRKMSESRKGIKFSEEHKKNLSKARRKRKITEKTKLKQSKSLKGKANIKKFILTSPDGVCYITENGLTAFCEEHGLTVANMHKVVQGERKHHKGWTSKGLYNESN
jgi:hypothetical protein